MVSHLTLIPLTIKQQTTTFQGQQSFPTLQLISHKSREEDHKETQTKQVPRSIVETVKQFKRLTQCKQ